MITSDGSTTLYIPEWDEQYHSKHGAIQEAYHVFIKNGLNCFKDINEVSILEVGFGTGLNCFITFLETNQTDVNIDYTGVEAYPVLQQEIEKLNYVTELKAKSNRKVFNKIHTLSWDEKHQLSTRFSLTKKQQFFEDINEIDTFNLIYYDAFGARVQPELWTERMFKKMYLSLKQNGILVTYSAKGSVRRALQQEGFVVERLPGPPGKREMLRARKQI